uniref:Uncharacterized protein n=1 Tax=Brugia timori TaxID=42155 RepID=A0A0R3QEI2_9BILA
MIPLGCEYAFYLSEFFYWSTLYRIQFRLFFGEN